MSRKSAADHPLLTVQTSLLAIRPSDASHKAFLASKWADEKFGTGWGLGMKPFAGFTRPRIESFVIDAIASNGSTVLVHRTTAQTFANAPVVSASRVRRPGALAVQGLSRRGAGLCAYGGVNVTSSYYLLEFYDCTKHSWAALPGYGSPHRIRAGLTSNQEESAQADASSARGPVSAAPQPSRAQWRAPRAPRGGRHRRTRSRAASACTARGWGPGGAKRNRVPTALACRRHGSVLCPPPPPPNVRCI